MMLEAVLLLGLSEAAAAQMPAKPCRASNLVASATPSMLGLRPEPSQADRSIKALAAASSFSGN